jgi:aryl-alcohol dehydrogenase-like predicted oxidoreductase
MQLDYADILLLGWFNRIPPKAVLDRARKLKEDGKCRAIAMSGHNRSTFGKLADLGTDNPIDIFMIRYNAAHTGAEKDIFPHLPNENRPGVIAYTATCWGKLLDPRKMPEGDLPLTAPECYRFVLSSPYIDMTLTGPANYDQLDYAAQALHVGPLTDVEETRIRNIGQHVHG